ncbi:FAR1-related sequence 5-like protein [Tanacetum coccineum]
MIHLQICPEIYDETDFKERFGKLVWNMFMKPLEFEGKWSKLVEDFGLQNHKWMTKMFDLRHMWLPAYFIQSPLFRLMRTTSRSESENAFFKNFTNHGSTLVNFMMCFIFAMERQCYMQEVLDFRTFDSAPKLHTKLTIEIHACKCGYCGEKTNKHTKTTCPLNPKYIAKLARTEVAAEQERRTAASATEQEERNSDTTHIDDKQQSNTTS